MDNKIVKASLYLGGVGLFILDCMILTDYAHKLTVHSMERKIYKQNIKINNKLIDILSKGTKKKSK